MRTVKTDYIVVGSGIAGLMTGLLLGNTGEVIILTKSREEASNSFRAQGGIAAAVGEGILPSCIGRTRCGRAFSIVIPHRWMCWSTWRPKRFNC